MSLLTLQFLLTALLIELTPGPNMTWLALLSARQGRAAGMLAVGGVAMGLTLLALLAGVGAGNFLSQNPTLSGIVRWAGVFFMLYLAVEAWIGEKPQRPSEASAARHFVRGVIVNLLNPKAAAVFVGVVPRFVDANQAGVWPLAWLSLLYVAIATAVHLLIVVFAASFQRWLSEPRRERAVRQIFAVLLAAVALWMAFAAP